MEELKSSVFLEKLLQKGYEVIFFTEAIDEYVMTHLTEFDDKKFQDASKDDLKLGKDDKKGLKKLKVRAAHLWLWRIRRNRHHNQSFVVKSIPKP